MTHKEFYTKHIEDLNSRKTTLESEMINCDDKDMRSKIGVTISQINKEIDETRSMLEGIDEPAAPAPVDDEMRAAIIGGSKEMRNDTVKGNVQEQRAQALKNESRFTMSGEETRSVLISSGALATPTKVGGITDPFSSVSSIVDMVRVEDMTGCGAYKEAYMKAWQEADAGTEGSAANNSDPTYSFVNMKPEIINVITYVSKEIRKQTPLQYLAKVQEGAAIALKKKLAGWIVGGTGTNSIYGIYNAIDTNSDSMIQAFNKSSAIDDKTLREIVFAYGGDDNLFGGVGVVLMLNKKDLIAFGDVRSATTLQPVYEITPDGTNPNTGTIKDGGLIVKYVINADCAAFVDAEATENGTPTMIVGDPENYKVGLFGDYEILVSEDYKFAEGMLAVRGEVSVAGNVIKGKGFVVVKKVPSNP